MPRRPVLIVVATGIAVLLVVAIGWPVDRLGHTPGARNCISETGTGGACQDGTALENPLGVFASADGRSAYVASDVSDAVVVFDRELPMGLLTQKPDAAGCVSETGSGEKCQNGRGLNAPNGIDGSPDGRHIYVASIGSDAVAVFDRDPASGSLRQKPGARACISEPGARRRCVHGKALDGALDVAVSPDGRSVYVASQLSDAIAVFDLEPATGSLTQKVGAAGCISESGDGLCQDGRALDGPLSVVVSAEGRSVYVASTNSDAVAIFDRDPASGALTQKSDSKACISETGTAGGCRDGRALRSAAGIAVSADGASVYVASQRSDALAIFDRNPVSGVLTQKGSRAGCISQTGVGPCRDGSALDGAIGVAVSTDGTLVYAASPRSDAVAIFVRDTATGALVQPRGTAGCVSEAPLRHCGHAAALDFPRDMAPSSDGKSVYVAAAASDAVVILDRRNPR
jgi:DNA-binding beta-propeller fold protein YncE